MNMRTVTHFLVRSLRITGAMNCDPGFHGCADFQQFLFSLVIDPFSVSLMVIVFCRLLAGRRESINYTELLHFNARIKLHTSFF